MARPARRSRRQTQVARLLLAAGAAGLAAYACARVENPPGGPPDAAPPRIVHVRPESGAVVPGWKDEAEFKFDEVIDEMPAAAAGGGGLGSLVLLSPVSGGVNVQWRRDRVTVEPREGWKAGRVYRLELLPGILDLRRNRLDSGRVVLFSTGPPIDSARLNGLALAWVEQRALARALIEAVPLPDSVGYRTLADSTGRFRLGGLAPGRYRVYASADPNTNRRRDAREAYDSVEIQLDSVATLALYAFPHDTIGPRLRTATFVDSLHVRLEFSQPLGPPLDTSRVSAVELPDSGATAVAAVQTQAEFDSLARQRRAAADTTAADTAAVDTAAVRPDTARAAADTSEVKRLLRARPVPSDKAILRFATPLKPETRYLIRVTGAMNLNGAAADGQAVVVTPKPIAPDTTRRASDRPAPSPVPPPPSPPS